MKDPRPFARTLLAACVLAVVLAGCGGEPQAPAGGDASSPPPPPPGAVPPIPGAPNAAPAPGGVTR